MKYLLDTHIFLWWYMDVPRLSQDYKNLLNRLEKENQEIGLSCISLWEIALLVSRNKIKTSFAIDTWFEELENDPLIHMLPITGHIALESTRLGDQFPADPADRIIAATARCHGLSLLTVDERIILAGAVMVA